MPAMELRYSEQALADLRQFIRYYEEAFFELYRDSGVWNEELIIQSYRESAQKLYRIGISILKFRQHYVLQTKCWTQLGTYQIRPRT